MDVEGSLSGEKIICQRDCESQLAAFDSRSRNLRSLDGSFEELANNGHAGRLGVGAFLGWLGLRPAACALRH